MKTLDDTMRHYVRTFRYAYNRNNFSRHKILLKRSAVISAAATERGVKLHLQTLRS